VGERGRGREKTSKTRGDYATAIREQRYVSEPIETKYRIFSNLIHTSFCRFLKGGGGKKLITLSLYIAMNTTTMEYNANATCFDLQQSSSG